MSSKTAAESFFTNIKLRRFKKTVRSEVRGLQRAYMAAEELAKYKYPVGSARAKELRQTVKQFTGRDYMQPNTILEKMRVRLTGEAIGDTQWLYGKEHAPLFTYAMGAPGRALGVYQTWWLNYAQFMGRIMKEVPRKLRGQEADLAPLATWVANNLMITLALVSAGWSAGKVIRTVGLGPFPTELPGAPGLAPFGHAAQAFGNLVFKGDKERAEKNMRTAFRRAWDNWVPGSLMYRELAKTGVAPQILMGETRLTPLPSLRYASTPEKVASVLGGRQVR